MSKNNRLTTISRGEANYLNLLDKNLFGPGGPLDDTYYNYASRERDAISFDHGYTPSANVFLNGIWNKNTGLPKDANGGIDVRSMNPTAYTLEQKEGFLADYNARLGKLKPKMSGSLIAGKVAGAVEGATGLVDTFMANEGSAERKAQHQKVAGQVSSINNAFYDTSSNKNLINSSSNAGRINTLGINASQYKGSKGAAAMNSLMGGLKGASAGAQVGGIWGAVVGAAVGIGSGIFGRVRANRLARKQAMKDKALAGEANALANDKLNRLFTQANENNALLSESNITAFGGPIDTLDITNPLGYGLAQDWLNVQLLKASKDKMSQLSNTTNTLGNDTLFKLFSNGGDLLEGDEIDLTSELIQELINQGYEFKNI